MRFLPITVLLLAFSLSGMANTGNPVDQSSTIKTLLSPTYSFSNIFFEDNEGEMLFVDFSAIDDDIKTIKMIRGEQLMLEDNVTDLPADAIYEFSFETVKPGIYTIEITTNQEIKIRKDVIIE